MTVPCEWMVTLGEIEQPVRWHLRSNSSPGMTACDLPMPTQKHGARIPFCYKCLCVALNPPEHEHKSALEEFHPKLHLGPKRD